MRGEWDEALPLRCLAVSSHWSVVEDGHALPEPPEDVVEAGPDPRDAKMRGHAPNEAEDFERVTVLGGDGEKHGVHGARHHCGGDRLVEHDHKIKRARYEAWLREQQYPLDKAICPGEEGRCP
jgi:hypothetical protein